MYSFSARRWSSTSSWRFTSIPSLDQRGGVLGANVPERQQLLQHDRHFHAIWRAERVELERVAANRQILIVRGSRDRAVDAGELTAARLVPGPHFWRRVLR